MTDPELARRLGVPESATVLASLGRLPVLAHHPTCARHDHHLVRPFGVPLCLGCTGVALGLGAGALSLLAWPAGDGIGPAFWHALAALGAMLPTFGQPYVQHRWYKLPARGLLGFALFQLGTSLWALPGTPLGWGLRLGLPLVTYALARVALEQRHRRLDDPCRGCPWGAFPLCVHHLPALRRARAASGPDAFLDALIADLEPLSAWPPRRGFVPPVALGARVAMPTTGEPPGGWPGAVPSPTTVTTPAEGVVPGAGASGTPGAPTSGTPSAPASPPDTRDEPPPR